MKFKLIITFLFLIIINKSLFIFSKTYQKETYEYSFNNLNDDKPNLIINTLEDHRKEILSYNCIIEDDHKYDTLRIRKAKIDKLSFINNSKNISNHKKNYKSFKNKHFYDTITIAPNKIKVSIQGEELGERNFLHEYLYKKEKQKAYSTLKVDSFKITNKIAKKYDLIEQKNTDINNLKKDKFHFDGIYEEGYFYKLRVRRYVLNNKDLNNELESWLVVKIIDKWQNKNQRLIETNDDTLFIKIQGQLIKEEENLCSAKSLNGVCVQFIPSPHQELPSTVSDLVFNPNTRIIPNDNKFQIEYHDDFDHMVSIKLQTNYDLHEEKLVPKIDAPMILDHLYREKVSEMVYDIEYYPTNSGKEIKIEEYLDYWNKDILDWKTRKYKFTKKDSNI